MGCASSKAALLADASEAGSQVKAEPAVQLVAVAREPAQPSGSAASTADHDVAPGAAAADAAEQPVAGLGAPSVMLQVRQVLQALSAIPADGSRASLRKAAEVLLLHFQGADTISLTACTAGSSLCVMGGAAGVGSSIIEQQLVTTDASLSAAVCNAQQAESDYFYKTVTRAEDVEQLPADWAELHRDAGLRTFLAVRMSSAGGPVGVMMLASQQQPTAFQEHWWEPLLSVVSSGLVPLLGHPLFAGLIDLGTKLVNQSGDDCGAYTATLLQHSAALLESITNLSLFVRLGLLSSDGQTVLVQHMCTDPVPVSGRGDTEGSSDPTWKSRHAGTLAAPGAPAAPAAAGLHSLALAGPVVSMVKLPAQGTLLMAALSSGGPQLVANTDVYMQSLARPPSDVFVPGQETIGSLVVLPLLLGSDALYKAVLYVADSKPGSFDAAKRPILSLGSMLGCLLVRHLQDGGVMARVWSEDAAQTAKRPSTSSAEAAPTEVSAAGPSSVNPQSTYLVALMQQQVRASADMSRKSRSIKYLDGLCLRKVLGKGGMGIVYAATWQRCPAAVKVMVVPKQQRRVMKGAMEMAVQESLSHPNIVRMYAFLTDLVVEAGSTTNGGPRTQSALQFRPAGANDPELTCNLMIMELCDCGSLDAALRQGWMHSMANGVCGVNVHKLLTVLLDVARSLQHIHNLGLVHCDLKPANVLIKSSSGHPLGAVCKLADFGLVKMMLHDRMYIRNNSASGTVAYMAPERLEPGSKLTPAVDIYAFGMLMWELHMRERPFDKAAPAAVIQAMVMQQRPVFPAGSFGEYQALAEACWSQDPSLRPNADTVVHKLQELLQGLLPEVAALPAAPIDTLAKAG